MSNDAEHLGLMPRSRRPYGFPVSRDWEDIDCKAVGCRFNFNEKCGVPSRAKFDETAKCAGFEMKPLPKKLDGD